MPRRASKGESLGLQDLDEDAILEAEHIVLLSLSYLASEHMGHVVTKRGVQGMCFVCYKSSPRLHTRLSFEEACLYTLASLACMLTK